MVKAHIVTADGATVNLEGTPTEIAALLKKLRDQVHTGGTLARAGSHVEQKKIARKTVNGLLDQLIGERFFKKPRGLGEVKDHLAGLGHPYPITALSGPLLGYVMKRKLRRIKEAGKFVYSQREDLQ